VHTFRRPLLPFTAFAALALCLITLPPARAAADEGRGIAFAQTGDATGVTATTATLNGIVDTKGHETTWAFVYGLTTAYGSTAPSTPAPIRTDRAVPVAVTVTGLAPATTYHYRLVVDRGFPGRDRTFTTAPAPVAQPAPAPVPTATPAAPLPGAATPTLGTSVGVTPVTGTVTVKVPGAATFATLTGGSAIPVGAVLDTRKGTVSLTTALDGGKTQTAQFHSGVFEVRQSKTGHGLTDIFLRGPAVECGGSTARAAAAQARRRRPPRRQLWGRDNGGRFRTHGKNSVATVRGTSWVTTDTCSGTRTTVRSGSVSVRDVHRHRTVLVRAGHSYLARRR
jgi:hypothetical protein